MQIQEINGQGLSSEMAQLLTGPWFLSCEVLCKREKKAHFLQIPHNEVHTTSVHTAPRHNQKRLIEGADTGASFGCWHSLLHPLHMRQVGMEVPAGPTSWLQPLRRPLPPGTRPAMPCRSLAPEGQRCQCDAWPPSRPPVNATSQH